MTLTDLEGNFKCPNSLGRLSSQETEDGSISLHNEYFNEAFHSKTGALKETINKFINPSELYRYKTGSAIFVLDICLGLGYNTGCLLEKLLKNKNKVISWSLEIDKRPLHYAVNNKKFLSCWSQDVIEIFQSIHNSGYWLHKHGKGHAIWADARDGINDIPESIKFDLILLDAFSPQKCPQLWTQEFLNSLTKKLTLGGRLITYCSASAIRQCLRKSGLEIFSIIPISNDSEWSAGTVAIKIDNQSKKVLSSQFFKPLTEMEEQHLFTKSSIPYRDPTKNAKASQIIRSRQNEQSESSLESTSSWKKRWKLAEYSLVD